MFLNKIRLLVLSMGVLATAPAFSAEQVLSSRSDDRDFRFSLAINPVTILFPWVELQFGLGFHPRFRLNLTPQIMTWAYGNDPFDGAVFGGTVSGTIFFSDWKGWYVEPGIVGLRPSRGGGYWIAFQTIGGYEFVFNSGFLINLGAGVGVGHFEDGSNNQDDWFDFDGTYPFPTGNLMIGWKF